MCEDINFIVICPNCKSFVVIEKINCAIFRHGIDKITQQQIPPHLDKESCDKLYNEGKLYGCGKPFKIVLNPKFDPKDKDSIKYIAEYCDYI